jgi:hypothetical protein
MRVPIGAFDFGQQSFDARVSDSDVRCGVVRERLRLALAAGRHFSGTSVAPPVTAARSEQLDAVAMLRFFLGRANLFL